MAFTVLGLHWSKPVLASSASPDLTLGPSYLFSVLATWLVAPAPGVLIDLHPLALAGWVGMLITALNLIPIGQLDGGHILYGLLKQRANHVASFLLLGAAVAIYLLWMWWWWLMLVLLVVMGPKHPPTADDDVPLGVWRTLLGWLTLAFLPLAFTLQPIVG